MSAPTPSPSAQSRNPVSESLREESVVHTRLLRLALGVQESRAYWAHVDPALRSSERAQVAFQQRWFGAKSMERVRLLLANFVVRYDAFAPALEVLRRWVGMDQKTRQILCHVHLQLADPIYRRFTGEFLPSRRAQPHVPLTRDAVLRWFDATYSEHRWSIATRIQFASKLLSAASEAGLISGKKDPRQFPAVRVPDDALGYLLYLLRGVSIEGTSFDNSYLASLGLVGPTLDARVRSLPGIRFARMGSLLDLHWEAADLLLWAERYLSPAAVEET